MIAPATPGSTLAGAGSRKRRLALLVGICALGLAGNGTTLLAAPWHPRATAGTHASAHLASPPAAAPIAAHWDPIPTAPKGAPNVLVILTDDVGFGASSTFGGPVPTPNLDRLAAKGVKFTNFHTTAMCSPTRAALLTGRNHHDAGFGAITEMQAGYPGYNNEIPADTRTFVEVLRRSGYATAMFGKHHMVADWMRSLTGPHKQWPSDLGFDYFYGFVAADSDQWHPTLIRGTDLVNTEARKDRLVDQDLADDAIHWLHQQKADDPAKPFFAYFATGSTHAPQQAPSDWIARFTGRFDKGWDALRDETVARQKREGILPATAPVSRRPAKLPAWQSLSAPEQRLYARYMEVFAAQLAFQDAQIGRVLDELQRMHQLDNTVVLFIEGDNGGSAEGGPHGSLSEMRKLFQAEAHFSAEEMADLDRLGGPGTYQIYPAGWGWAVNAPFPLFKQDASHLGGVRNGAVVSWPKGIAQPGRTVGRFQHVVDIAPTVLQLAGVTFPKSVDGVAQKPLAGVSMVDALDSPHPAEKSRTQYFEIAGNRALYKDGWWAGTVPGRMPWEPFASIPAKDFKWQLFDLHSDPAQAVDLSARYPKRLAAMQAEWNRQARLHHVYPMRANADVEEIRLLSRPLPKRDDYVFWGSDVHLPWTAQPDLQRGNFSIDARFTLADDKQAQGVILATGSSMAGWSLKLEDGAVTLYSASSEARADHYRIASAERVGVGSHDLTVRFLADDGKLGSGGSIVIALDGKTVATGRIERRSIRPIGVNEMFDIGMDTGASVVPGEGNWQRFQGTIDKVTVKAGI